MKRSGSGRVARKIGAYDEDSAESTDTSQGGIQDRTTESVVKRPTFAKAKKRSSLRVSFGPNEAVSNDGDGSSDTAVITPKKSNLSRIAIEKNAEHRSRSPLVSELSLSRASLDDDRPTYNKDYLAELRNSTPSTPKDIKLSEEDEEESRALDITSKFGPSASLTLNAPLPTSAIPTAAEIQEKKARRARLAKEQEARDDDEDRSWASDDDDDEFRNSRNEISLRPKEKYAETRLVRDDEDIAEGFDEYVEDGSISIGRKAEREAEKKRRAEMADLINDAEGGSSDDDSEDSEADRNAAYEAAQTRAGAYGKKEEKVDDGARTPPRMTPIPDLGDAVEHLQAGVTSLEQRKEAILKRMEEMKEERARIAERKTYLQEQLQKTGDEYERRRQEAGLAALATTEMKGGRLIVDRGLDSIGTTPLATTPETARSDSPGDE